MMKPDVVSAALDDVAGTETALYVTTWQAFDPELRHYQMMMVL